MQEALGVGSGEGSWDTPDTPSILNPTAVLCYPIDEAIYISCLLYHPPSVFISSGETGTIDGPKTLAAFQEESVVRDSGHCYETTVTNAVQDDV